jgi:hypothetical protein
MNGLQGTIKNGQIVLDAPGALKAGEHPPQDQQAQANE